MHAGVHRTNQRKVQRQVGLRALQRSRQRRDRQKNRGEKTDQHRRSSGETHELLQAILVTEDEIKDL
ncbi:hypothetical protein LINGRAHAP2_LOCUS21381 [Linum grandiflorum]